MSKEDKVDRAIRHKGVSFHYKEGEAMSMDNEIHNFLEFVYIIEGRTTFITEKFYEEVGAGALLVIPAHTYHQFVFSENEKFKFITMNIRGYDDERSQLLQGLNEACVISDPKSEYIHTVKRICKFLKTKDKSLGTKTWLYGTTMALLAEMNIRGDLFVIQTNPGKHSPLIIGALEYIEENLFSDISVDFIAEAMHVSSSTLFHSFKKELGISLYKFIMQKRLMHARKLMDEGEKPTEVYYKCGYKDYSTFYRAFRNMFGVNPTGKVTLRTINP